MSRISSHQSGLGSPDEVLGDGDGTDGGGGEKGMRGMGLAEIGAKKCRSGLPKEVGAPETGIRRKRPSDAPGQRPQSLVLEAELNRHGNVNFDALSVIVKALPRVFCHPIASR